MASSPQQQQQQQQPSSIGSCPPTAQVVGNAFVHQYYHILHQSPEFVYRFYLNNSKLGRPESEKGVMSCITTMRAINEKILSLDYSEFRAEITTVDAQESLNAGVLVLVTGYLTGKDNVRRNFTQSFFLAPQDKGYFVLNDIFRYMEEEVNYHNGNEGMTNGVATPSAAEHAPATAQEHHNFEQSASLPKEEDDGQEVCDPPDNEDGSIVEEETPVPEVVKEIQVVSESSSASQEETPKKSYASIVKVVKESVSSSSVPASSPSKPAPANQEQQMAASPPPDVPADVPVSSGSNANESSSTQEGEAGGYSIYIKNLPLNATAPQLEEEFKRFGPIKNGGIQVRSNKQQGFCFGFVEFEVPSAVQSAVEASPITIGSRQAYVEEKRPSSSGVNNRSRFSGRGSGSGFRNYGGRGRGNYGSGRSYGRMDFNHRSEFNSTGRGGGSSRGGSSGPGPGRGRGGDGVYQRVDHLGGNNSGRMNRTSGLTSRTVVTPRVPAPAWIGV